MNRMQEFWYCVSSQEELPLFKGQEISSEVCENLISLIENYKDASTKHTSIKDFIEEALLRNPLIVSDLRVLLGISDKRFYLDLTFIYNRVTLPSGKRLVHESRENLVKHTTTYFVNKMTKGPDRETHAGIIAQYFVSRGIQIILDTFSEMNSLQITSIFNNLIAPKEIQQKQAKYRGHSAEMLFSKTFQECGLHIFPEDKAVNPMGSYDPNVDLSNMSIVSKSEGNPNIHSFDLVIKDNEGTIRILIQSLIHSSDPGQYGVNKSDETIEIKKLIDAYNSSHPHKNVYLLGSVDGVGFSENPNGTIGKMLNYFDDFFQINTLFKICIFLQKYGFITNLKGIKFDTSFFDVSAIKHFEEEYILPAGIQNLTNDSSSYSKSLTAGKATVIFD